MQSKSIALIFTCNTIQTPAQVYCSLSRCDCTVMQLTLPPSLRHEMRSLERVFFVFFQGSFQIKVIIYCIAVGFLAATLTRLRVDSCTDATVSYERVWGYAKETERMAATSPTATLKWLWKHAHLKACVHILVYTLCVYTWNLTAINASCNP